MRTTNGAFGGRSVSKKVNDQQARCKKVERPREVLIKGIFFFFVRNLRITIGVEEYIISDD